MARTLCSLLLLSILSACTGLHDGDDDSRAKSRGDGGARDDAGRSVSGIRGGAMDAGGDGDHDDAGRNSSGHDAAESETLADAALMSDPSSAGTGSMHTTSADASTPDAALPSMMMTTPPPPPACLGVKSHCDSASQCCGPLTCSNTTLGSVCCGLQGTPCATANGEDCCGSLECGQTTLGRVCCGLARTPCATDNGEDCCGQLSCGHTTLGRVCCGEAGAPCATNNGEDCCGNLDCIDGRCG